MKRDPRKRYSLTPRFVPPVGGVPGFAGLMPRRILPKPGHVLHMVVEGDRLDRLAHHYYGDPRLWWVIAQANLDRVFPHDLVYLDTAGEERAMFRIGEELHIPPRPEEAE